MKIFDGNLYKFYDTLSNKELDYMIKYLESKIKRIEDSYKLAFIKYSDELLNEYDTVKAVKNKRIEKIQSYKNKKPRRFIK